MTLQQEAQEIIVNATAAYFRGEITLQQWRDVTRLAIKDAGLEKEMK